MIASLTRRLAIALVVLAAAAVAPWSRLHAADEAVDLELVLAVDVSWSMDPEEQALQRGGYVQAFRDPEVQKAMISGAHRKIAVTYFEWAGPSIQYVVMPWTVIRSPADAERFAERLSTQPIQRHRMTSISGALEFAARLFTVDQISGTRRVVDVSGDGPNNAGLPVVPVRDRLVADGIVINGLPVVLRPSYSTSWFDIPNLEDYYAACVIGGPGSFMIPVRERREFATATRQKLLLEIAGINPEPRLVPAQLKPAGPAADCMIGEVLWKRYMDR